MRVLFITSGSEDPGTRFRASQFFPYFEANGIRCTHRGAYGGWYNRLFDVPVLGPGYKLGCRLKRAVYGLEAWRYDAVVLQRTALDFTPLPERVLARLNPRVVLDVDDAVFLDPNGSAEAPRRERTFREVVRLSAHVIAGNDYLAEHARAPAKTTVIPTVIDTDRYRPLDGEARSGPLVIGWMGTAGNFTYFGPMLPAIRRVLDERPDTIFRIVSNAPFEPLRGHPQVEQVRWSEAAELDELRRFDVGIMPLVDSTWARGKNGFKLIQYMSVGRPVVASPVGVNPQILDGGGAGLLAGDGEEWHRALTRLCADAALRRDLGRAARARVVHRYSIRSVLDTYVDLFARVAAGRGRGGGGLENRNE